MSQWFTVKMKFDRQGEDGLITKVTEPFLVDAVTFTDAEKRVLEEIKAYATTGDIDVADIKKTKIAELVYDESGDRWYRCKINYMTIDENKGVEKKTPQIVMVQADSLRRALDNLVKNMEKFMGDYEIGMITETNILDVFAYDLAKSAEALTENAPQ